MKSKKKNSTLYTISSVALVLLLTISIVLSLVVFGVVEDEKNKKPQTNTNSTGNAVETSLTFDEEIYNDVFFDETVVNPGATDVSSVVEVTDNQGAVIGTTNVVIPNGNQSNGVTTIPYLKQPNKSAADIVKIYASVMNNAKSKAPAFTKIEYQELPDGPENRVISEGTEHAGDEAVNKMLNFVTNLGVFVPKEDAEANPYVHNKGDADMARFPVFDREKGSYLTDPKGIESYTYQILANGNVKMTFVLVPEDNPEPIGETETVAPSYTGAIFSPMSKARIDGTVYHPIVTVFAKNIKYSLRYHDCSVEVEFNPDTLEIVNLKQIANVSIKGSGDVVGAGHIGLERQELISTVIIKDLDY